jgi:hypothetical protein
MLIKNLSIIILNDRHDRMFEQALLSAACAQEVIVIDQETNNHWPHLEKKLKKLNPDIHCRLIIRKNPVKNFANVRNQAIKAVHTTWLMFLDSDEILSKKDWYKINHLINSDQIDAYRLKRVDYFHGQKMRFGETGNYFVVRLAKTNMIQYQRQVHEVPQITGRVGQSSLVIKHFPHQHLSGFLKTINNYAQLEVNYRFTKNIPYTKVKIYFELLIYPSGKFLLNYLFKLGLLDGFAGLSYAVMMSLHSLLVRVYLYEKYFLN